MKTLQPSGLGAAANIRRTVETRQKCMFLSLGIADDIVVVRANRKLSGSESPDLQNT